MKKKYTSDQLKNKMLTIKVTQAEKDKIKMVAKDLKMSVAKLLTKDILKNKLSERDILKNKLAVLMKQSEEFVKKK